MKLVIAAQDIHACEVGIFDREKLTHQKNFETAPDGHLAAIESALREWGIAKTTLTGIAVVRGPGSFTASRSSVATANALAFALTLPIFPFSNPERRPFSELADLITSAAASPLPVLPEYDKAPHITPSKKNVLAA